MIYKESDLDNSLDLNRLDEGYNVSISMIPMRESARLGENLISLEESIKYIKSICKNCVIFRSICSATQKRQQEARKYSKNCDFSVVVGGKKSSNTRKLFNICSENCKTFFIENVKELENLKCSFKNKDIFLTAGASTPDFLIKEVFYNLSKRI